MNMAKSIFLVFHFKKHHFARKPRTDCEHKSIAILEAFAHEFFEDVEDGAARHIPIIIHDLANIFYLLCRYFQGFLIRRENFFPAGMENKIADIAESKT